MVHLPLFAACIAAVVYQAITATALPVAIRPSASVILPVTYASNPQRPFARPAPSPRLHMVDDSSEDAIVAPSWTALERFAAQASLPAVAAAVTNDDSLFSDTLFPFSAGAVPTGVEASIAAVLASRQLRGVEKWQPDAGVPKTLHRRSAVAQAPIESARMTMKDRKAQKAGMEGRRTMGTVLRAEQTAGIVATAQRV